MIAKGNTVKYLDCLLYLFYLTFLVSIICSFRAISSIAIGCTLVIGLIKNKIETGSFFNKNLKNCFIICCCIFYLLQVASLFYTHNLPETFAQLRIKSALILLPVSLCCCNFLNAESVKRLMKHYVWIISAVMLCCLIIATYKYYFLHAGNEVFFYHEVVSPFKQHAVQVSVFLFFGLVYLLVSANKDWYLNNKSLHILFIVYFIFCIVLLSSKLVIIFTTVVLIYFIITFFKTHQNLYLIAFTTIFICIVITLVLLTNNPVNKRFNEIISGKISLANQEKFSPGIYFNGLQFRLLQWRFVGEILDENHAWLIGVSPGDAQTYLNNKYITTNMYIGENNNSGFLGYNAHNEFLQSLLESGVMGLLLFIGICGSLIRFALQKRSIVFSSILILLILYGLNESFFETQYGVILFTFFPLFFIME